MGEEHRYRKRKVYLRLFDEEFQMLEDQCEKFSMSKSEFLRNCILFGGIYSSEKMDKEDLKKFLYELNRIGNNVNQIAYNTNSKKSTDREDMLKLTEEFKSFMKLYKEFAYEIKK